MGNHIASTALFALAALLVPPAASQTLERVRVDAEEPAALARELERAGFDVLHGAGPGVDLVVSPDERAALAARGLEPVTIAVGAPLVATLPEGVPTGYVDGPGLLAQMQALQATYPGLARVVDLTATLGAPPTWGGRSIHALKISDAVTLDEDEPAVLVVAGYHCREIVTPVIALEAASRLLAGHGSDPALTALVDGHEIWIAPSWNPDGYDYVFTADNLWRKNRRDNGGGSFGVDLNRNHALGWSSACSGSSSTGSQTYKGPAPSSEPETLTMEAFTAAERFAKVIDFHSSGREALWGYACLSHPWDLSLLQPSAIALAVASGYGSSERSPSADGEHYQWQLGQGAFAFLVETHTTFQPDFTSAQAEAALVWPGIRWMLERPVSVSGHVSEACSGAGLAATVEVLGAGFTNGEGFSSGGAFGRYDLVLPAGTHSLRFSAPGRTSQTHVVQVSSSSSQTLEVQLGPGAPAVTYCTAKTNSAGCAPGMGFSGTASASAGSGFVVSAANVLNQKVGLLFYGRNGRLAKPFQGGFKCVKAPTRRTPLQSSGGSTGGNDCSGSFALDFNAWVAGGRDPQLVAGVTVQAQYWSRDPASPATTSLTDALEFSICP